jgi:hypothetical protein
MIGDINKSSQLSMYQPPEPVAEFTKYVKEDYAQGQEILERSWLELNYRSIIDDENRGQMMFNAFVDTSIEDPDEAWKYRGTRSMARNKGIAMHANLTANFLLPLFVAQNDEDEIDRDFAEVMRDIIEWMASPTNSNYQSSFLSVVFGMIKNPVTFLGAEYCEIMQTIRVRSASGEYTTKEILDEVLSGFQAPIYSSTQVLITNAFERNIQKQRRIIKRRYVERSELEAKFGEHPNWTFVTEGQRSIYNDEDGLFYDIKDDEHPFLVAEEIAESRRDDSQVVFLGGVYMGEVDVENNPIAHRDNRNAPKYNVVPFVYNNIGEHFFYGKSMMNAVGWDNTLYDAMSEVVMNNALLEQDPPTVTSGGEKIDSEINFPGAVVASEDPNFKAQRIFPPKDFVAGFNALEATKESINEGTLSDTATGQLPEASQKAYTVAQASQAAKKIITGVGKSLGASVAMYGDLMKDIAINNITAPQVTELVGGAMKLKYRSFMLDNKNIGGKTVSKHVKFDESLIGVEMTDEEIRDGHLKLLEESGYPNNKTALLRVNPEKFAKFKYYCKVDVEEMFTRNAEYWQPILLNLKTALIQDPYIDQEALTRKLMYSYFRSEGDSLVKKLGSAMPGEVPVLPNGAPPNNGGAGGYGSRVTNELLSTAAKGAAVQ